MIRNFNKEQRGATVAEFAIVASVFFMMIFGIIEFGRLLYTHNALTDAARRGARYAALHHQSTACVKNVTVYGDTHIDPNTCAPTGPPLVNGLTAANVTVIYEGADLDNNPATPQTSYGMNLGTATVKIENYAFDLTVPLFQVRINMPTYTTTLTAESAGEAPNNL
jgi:Flp pilus assembly protein TadG